MYDGALIQYILICVVALVGSIVFVSWMIYKKFHVSSVYLYVTIMLIGEAYRSAITIHGRILAMAHDERFYDFTLSYLWTTRAVIYLIGMTALVSHMTYRVITNHDLEKLTKFGDKVSVVLIKLFNGKKKR